MSAVIHNKRSTSSERRILFFLFLLKMEIVRAEEFSENVCLQVYITPRARARDRITREREIGFPISRRLFMKRNTKIEERCAQLYERCYEQNRDVFEYSGGDKSALRDTRGEYKRGQ